MPIVKFTGLNVRLFNIALEVMSLCEAETMLKWWKGGFYVKGRASYNDPENAGMEVILGVEKDNLRDFVSVVSDDENVGCVLEKENMLILLRAIKGRDEVTLSYDYNPDANAAESLIIVYDRDDYHDRIRLLLKSEMGINGYEVHELQSIQAAKCVTIPAPVFGFVLDKATGIDKLHLELAQPEGDDDADVDDEDLNVVFFQRQLNLYHKLFSESQECLVVREDRNDRVIRHNGVHMRVQAVLRNINPILGVYKFLELREVDGGGTVLFCTIPGLGSIKFFTP